MNLNKISKRKAAVILFLVALVVRLSILVFFDHNQIPGDATGYHRLAVNLVRGNGFSNQEQEPFEKYYFREPGYPVFLAGIYFIVNIFDPVQYIKQDSLKDHKLDTFYPEIVVSKIVQILLDSFGVVLLFFILAKISNIKIAFLTCMMTALFFNLAFHSVYLLRESLVVFLLLVLNLFYIKYLYSEKNYLWLTLMGITIGMLILTFQVHAVILPVLFILMWINSKKFKKSLIRTVMVSAIALIIIVPFGTSFTHEMLEYNRIISLLSRHNIISREEYYSMREWTKPSKIQFERSFNGYYSKKTDSLKKLIPTEYNSKSYKMKRKLKVYFNNFKKSVFLTKIGYFSGKDLINKYGPLILFPLIIFPALIGFSGLIGLVFFWKKYLIYLLPFLVYLILFWILGSEYRRMIIIQPFLIFFGILLFGKILEKFDIHWFKPDNAESLKSQTNDF